MPRVAVKRWKEDDLVQPLDSFAGTLADGAAFSIAVDEVLRGDHPVVRQHPEKFRREADEAARQAYWDNHFREVAEQRARERADEEKRVADLRKRVLKRADELEPEIRKGRLARQEQTIAFFGETVDERRRSDEDRQKRADEASIERLAMAEVERRLAASPDDGAAA